MKIKVNRDSVCLGEIYCMYCGDTYAMGREDWLDEIHNQKNR